MRRSGQATRHLRDSWRIIAGNSFQQLTQERGLRDGWEQTAGELQAQVQQGDNNLQRVEAERDEALGHVESLGDKLHSVERGKEATIERLEAALKDAQHVYERDIKEVKGSLRKAERNDHRDSRGRFIGGG